MLESLVKSLVREAEACKPRITHPLDVTTVDENDHKMTLLAFSLCCKNKKITEMLIENGASKTHILAQGWTYEGGVADKRRV